MRKLTTPQFIEKAIQIHGDRYDYSQTVYKTSGEPVLIHCNTHGDFSQRPNDHVRGQGCPKCGKVSYSKTRRKSADDFIAEAKAIHGDKYDYSRVEYNGTHAKVCIICPTHGEFFQKPNNHISNEQGCIHCSRAAHPGRYMEHRFDTDESKSQPGVFYVLAFSNETECFIKIGITAVSTKERHAGKTKGYRMEILHNIPTTLYNALVLENQLKASLQPFKYEPKHLHEGHTECFMVSALPLIESKLTLLCS